MGERVNLSFKYLDIIIEKKDIEKFLNSLDGLCNAFAVVSGTDEKTGKDLKEWCYKFESNYENT